MTRSAAHSGIRGRASGLLMIVHRSLASPEVRPRTWRANVQTGLRTYEGTK